MTLRPGTDARGHHSRTMQPPRTGPALVYRKARRHGITRLPDRPRPPKDRPLSARHAQILAQLGAEPARVAAIARALNLPRDGVNSSLYSLAARELVTRIPGRGWVSTPPPQTCIYCDQPTGTEYDEHDACSEAALQTALDDEDDEDETQARR